MRTLAPWRDRVLLDLGCGSGFWLPGYADEAARVIGVEPDPALVPLAESRTPRATGRRGRRRRVSRTPPMRGGASGVRSASR
jgi:predicted RNA methylase